MYDLLDKRLKIVEDKLHKSQTAPTFPIYDTNDLPQDAVVGQIALGTDGSINWFDGAWNHHLGKPSIVRDVPQDIVEGQIALGGDHSLNWYVTGTWHSVAGVKTSGNPPQDAVTGQLVLGTGGLAWHDDGIWYGFAATPITTYYWFGTFFAAEFLSQAEVAGFLIEVSATALDSSHTTSGIGAVADIITLDGPGNGPAVDTIVNDNAWHTIYCETQYVGSGDFSGLNYHAWRYLQKTDGVTAFESTAVYFSDIDAVITGMNIAAIFQNNYYVKDLTIVMGSTTYSHTFDDGTLGPFFHTGGTSWTTVTVGGVQAIAGNLDFYPGTLGIDLAPGPGVTFASIEYTAFFPSGWPG